MGAGSLSKVFAIRIRTIGCGGRDRRASFVPNLGALSRVDCGEEGHWPSYGPVALAGMPTASAIAPVHCYVLEGHTQLSGSAF